MWKTLGVPVLVLMLALAACGPSHPVKPGAKSTPVATSSTPDEALVRQQLADASKLVADKNWPQAVEALQGIIETNSFSRLSASLQREVLIVTGEVALYHGSSNLAYECFVRATSLPNTEFDEWVGRLNAAYKVGNITDSVSTLTVLVQRWPARTVQFPPKNILSAIHEAKQAGGDAALPLLKGLYDAHWKLNWDIEPSDAWCDLILRLVEKGQLSQAVDVSSHVTDVYVLIAMRADRRFDAVVAANPGQFDIDAAAQRAFQTFQAAAEHAPDSLELQYHVIEALLSQQRYEAALAACDSILYSIRSTNYPAKLYTDFDDHYNWILNERAELLERVGRWDEALAQLRAASQLSEDHTNNVSQVINLAHLYCDLERPKEALEALGRMKGKPSPYGAMQFEKVRLIAASQLGDSLQVARSMQYLEQHRADLPDAYEDALIYANQPDRAAKLLLERLRNKDQRTQALSDVQTYAAPLRTPRQVEYNALWGTVLARRDVRDAIQRVGRIEEYKVEER
jgi:beta-barrel assembly-enhancing protease